MNTNPSSATTTHVPTDNTSTNTISDVKTAKKDVVPVNLRNIPASTSHPLENDDEFFRHMSLEQWQVISHNQEGAYDNVCMMFAFVICREEFYSLLYVNLYVLKILCF